MEKTVSLDVAKELKELGWKKETLFVWDRAHESSSTFDDYNDENNNFVTSFFESSGYKIAYAPQLHEILEVLPYKISIDTANAFLKMEIFEDDYRIGYYEFDQHPWGEQISENPHDAAAKLLIWCIKNNFVTL